jgi:hypothetical protein
MQRKRKTNLVIQHGYNASEERKIRNGRCKNEGNQYVKKDETNKKGQ